MSSLPKRINLAEFLEQVPKGFYEKHSFVDIGSNYKRVGEAIPALCKDHGEYMANPRAIISGNGCKLCVHKGLRKTYTEFLKEARDAHGELYSYPENIVLSTIKQKVPIECKKHGVFEQAAIKHLRGQGCPTCRGGLGVDWEDVVSKAKEHHKNFYLNYRPETEYISVYSKVVVTCPHHGDYTVQARKLMEGHGCKKCFSKSLTKTTDQFIAGAKLVHGDRYGYSKSKYLGSHTKLTITCNVHGDFEQPPTSHLGGKGCPCCGSESSTYYNPTLAERHKAKYIETPCSLYLVKLTHQLSNKEYYKVGISISLKQRLTALARDSEMLVELLGTHKSDLYHCILVESEVLNRESRATVPYKFAGHSECIEIRNVDHLESIKRELELHFISKDNK